MDVAIDNNQMRCTRASGHHLRKPAHKMRGGSLRLGSHLRTAMTITHKINSDSTRTLHGLGTSTVLCAVRFAINALTPSGLVFRFSLKRAIPDDSPAHDEPDDLPVTDEPGEALETDALDGATATEEPDEAPATSELGDCRSSGSGCLRTHRLTFQPVFPLKPFARVLAPRG